MPEGFKAQISASQNEITKLQESTDNPDLKNTLQKYQAIFVGEVNTAQADLAKTEDQLSSPEAKALLQNAPAKILEFMMKIGQKGSAIKKTTDQKEKKNASSIDQLARELESFLTEEKAELPNFVAITEIAKAHEQLESHPPTTDPEKLIQAKKELMAKLPGMTKVSTSYKQEISQKIQDSIADLGILKADQLLLKISTTDLQTLEKLTQEYEQKPTPENFTKVQEVRTKIDLKKLGDEVFNGKIDGNNPLISNLYQKLWQEQFQSAEKRLTTLAERIDAKEKTVLAPQIIVLLAATEKTWEQVLQPKITQYEQTNASQENYAELEKGLFADLLKTRSLLAPFANERNKDKLEFTVFQGLTDRFQKINEMIKKIETNREVHRNDQGMSSQGLLQYVKFPTKDGDQVVNDQNYSFTPAFYQLSEAQQLVIRSQIEKIAAHNKLSVQKETEKASLEFLQPEEKLQKLTEMLGEKGKSYFNALEKLKNKDVDGAIEIFQTYLKQSFSSEELKIQRETLQDAKEKIQGLFNEKLNQVDNLLSDVKQLKQAERKLGGNPELHVDESIEVSAIDSEISAFRKEILAGEILNFNERFTDLQKNVRAKLAEKQSSETDILKKLEQLHLLSLEHDPKKRKEGFIAFAQEARDMQGYHLAKKYLDYALADEFQKASKDLSRQEVLKQMVADPDFLPKLKEQAHLAHSKMIQENPALRGKLTLEVVQDQLLQGELDTRYSRELRKFITPVDSTNSSLEKYDSALALYNNWFPLEQTPWYNPLEYGAEAWDDFQVDCVKFVFEQLPTLGIGMAAGAAGRAGAKLGGKAVLKYLVKMGLSEAEIALVEGGGIQALKASLTSGKAFTLSASRLLGAVALEGTTMYGLGQVQQFLETGHVPDFEKSPGKNISDHLLESMVKVSLFKAIGMGTQMIKPLAAASEKGGAIAKAAWLGRETLSGAGGTILDYAIGKLKGHDMSGQEIFQAMISNYLISVGMSAAENHGDSRKTKEMIESYGKEKTGAAEKMLRQIGVDPKNPESITTARITPDGQVILNGKTIPGMRPDILGSLSPELQQKISELGEKNSLNTHFKSGLSANVPRELWPDPNNPESAKQVKGWIDKDGKIYYNLDYLNSDTNNPSEKAGPYRESQNPSKKFLPEGWKLQTNAKGDFIIVTDKGNVFSYKEFAKSPMGQRLHAELIRIKDHEIIHRLIEASNITSNGTMNKDIAALIKADSELFEAFGPREQDPKSVQEFLCQIADGTMQVSVEVKAKLEQALSKHIEGFTFDKARQLDTKALGKSNPKELVRASTDAMGGEPTPIQTIPEFIKNDALVAADIQKALEGSGIISFSPAKNMRMADVQYMIDRYREIARKIVGYDIKITINSESNPARLIFSIKEKRFYNTETEDVKVNKQIDDALNGDGEIRIKVSNEIHVDPIIASYRKIASMRLGYEIRATYDSDNGLITLKLRERRVNQPSAHEATQGEPPIKQAIVKSFQEFGKGIFDEKNPIHVELKNLYDKDRQGYEILAKNIHTLTIDAIDAIRSGTKVEFIDSEGKQIRCYKIGDYGDGLQARVEKVVYAVNGGTEVQLGALRIKKVQGKKYTSEEIEKAKKINEVGHPMLNKALHMSEDFFLYESGNDKTDLEHDLRQLPTKEALTKLRDVIQGYLEAFQQLGYAHGDLHGSNVITYTNLHGKRVTQFIDINWENLSKVNVGKKNAILTWDYYQFRLFIDDIIETHDDLPGQIGKAKRKLPTNTADVENFIKNPQALNELLVIINSALAQLP